MMQHNINDTILRRFFQKKCSSEEKKEINDYLKTPEGQFHLDLFIKNEWGLSQNDSLLSEEIMEEYRQELWRRVMQAGRIKHERTPVWRLPVFRYAAIVALFLCTAIVVYLWRSNFDNDAITAYKEVTNPKGVRSEVKLPDGSVVYLGAGSVIQYPKTFDGDIREIVLRGEAFFEVARDTLHPFIVQTDDIRTQVLGTSFKLKAFDKDVQVSVATGRVRVDRVLADGRVEPLATLEPGEEVHYAGLLQSFTHKQIAIKDLENWRAGKIVFNGTPLVDMLDEVGRNYDLSFVIQREDLMTVPITVTLDTTTNIGDLLRSLSIYVGFDYTIGHDEITIQ